MDANRAQEIVSSKDDITVKWNGVSVWIDSVDPAEATADVHAENDPHNRQTVSVEQLQEVGSRNVH